MENPTDSPHGAPIAEKDLLTMTTRPDAPIVGERSRQTMTKEVKTMEKYKGYHLREHNGKLYPFKARPYDDANYYYAVSENGESWVIAYNGKRIKTAYCDFFGVVDILEDLNANIKPIMCHN